MEQFWNINFRFCNYSGEKEIMERQEQVRANTMVELLDLINWV